MLWASFYLEQNEDYSLKDNISDSSEKLLQRGRGEGQYIVDFGEGGVHAIKHIFFFSGFCLSQGAIVTMNDFSAFL